MHQQTPLKVVDDTSKLPILDHIENEVFIFKHSKPISLSYTSSLSLKYVQEGRVDYKLDNKYISVKSGEFLLIKNNSQITSSISLPTIGVAIFLVRDLENHIQENIFNTPYSLINSSLKKSINEIILKNNLLANKKAVLHDIKLGIIDYNLELNRIYQKLNYERLKTKKDILLKILKAKTIIESDFNKHITIDEISEKICLSKFLFIRKFKEVFGITPGKIVLQIKIETSLKLIKETKFTISEISTICGFSSIQHFSKAFKKIAGHPPSYFQKNIAAIDNFPVIEIVKDFTLLKRH